MTSQFKESLPHILDFHPEKLMQKLSDICDKKYQIQQIFSWIYRYHTLDLSVMSNVKKSVLKSLEQSFDLSIPQIINQICSNDGTIKFIIKLNDNNIIEMVYIPTEKKNTLCISTQVGCARNCYFCATAQLGFIRNLLPFEILCQLILIYQKFPTKKITNIVLMGMGEPLDNFNNVINALKTIQSEHAFNINGRRVTLSTCGVTPKIIDLINSGIKLKLAISLNSAIDAKRSELMPVNDTYSLKELKKTIIQFRKNTPYRVTLEYILIKNFNMADEDIEALIKFANDISCKINFIKWNNVNGLKWQSPDNNQIDLFLQRMKRAPIAVTYRHSRGDDINGACGQLAGKYEY